MNFHRIIWDYIAASTAGKKPLWQVFFINCMSSLLLLHGFHYVAVSIAQPESMDEHQLFTLLYFIASSPIVVWLLICFWRSAFNYKSYANMKLLGYLIRIYVALSFVYLLAYPVWLVVQLTHEDKEIDTPIETIKPF